MAPSRRSGNSSWSIVAAAPVVVRDDGSWQDFLIWAGILIVALGVGALLIALVRRRLAAGGSDRGDDFTLDGLRRMHARGELTREEFERAKQTLIDRLKGPPGGPAAESVARLRGRARGADKEASTDATDERTSRGEP